MNSIDRDGAFRRNRGGFALPVAVLAMVVVGVLVTAGFWMAQQESRIGVASKNSSMAFYIAEQGMNQVMADWSAARYSQIALWDTAVVSGSIPQGSYMVSVHRLSNFMYFLESEGVVTEGGRLAGANRKLGMIAKIRTADIEPDAALTTRGRVDVQGNGLVNGNDSIPNGWGSLCDATDLENKPGVLYDTGGQVNTPGGGRVLGNPATNRDAGIDQGTFLDYGDLGWEDLIELASAHPTGNNITTAPSLTGSVCNSNDNNNWGEPYTSTTVVTPAVTPVTACQDYFPIIHHAGPTLRLQAGSRGQGILLVGTVTYNQDGSVATMTGNLDLRGNFTFYGIIIVLGQFETQGTGNRIIGGVLSGNGVIDTGCNGSGCIQDITGGSVVQYSSCAIERAVINNSDLAMARPFIERSWVDLSNLSYN